MVRRRNHILAVCWLVGVTASCTSAANAPPPAAASGDVEVADPAPRAAPVPAEMTVVVEELPLDVAAAVGVELAEAEFALEGLQSFRLDWHAVGTLLPLRGEPEPALYRTRGDDLSSWTRVPLPLPEPYVRGELATVDHPDRYVAWLQDAEDRVAALMLTRAGAVVALVDDATVVDVRNVVATAGGDLVLGSRHDADGQRTAAAWLVGPTGEPAAVRLPQAEQLVGATAALTAAVSGPDGHLLFGIAGDSDELVVLGGPLDDLQVIDVPSGLSDASHVTTSVEVDGVWWAGGSSRRDGIWYEEVWSTVDGTTWRPRMQELREAVDGQVGRGSVGLLRASAWRSQSDREYRPVIVLAKAATTLRWDVDGERIVEAFQNGGDRAAFADNTLLIHDRTDDVWGRDGERVGEFRDVAGLPPGTRVAPYVEVIDTDRDLVAVGTGHDGAGETVVIDHDGVEHGRAEGTLAFGRGSDTIWLSGHHRGEDGLAPQIIEIAEDGDWIVQRPSLPAEVGTARLSAMLEVDGVPTVFGHRWSGSTLAALVLQPAPEGSWQAVTLPGLTDRGVAGACGEVLRTYDEAFRLGLAWVVDGVVVDHLLDEDADLDRHACDQDASGHVWIEGPRGLIQRVTPSGERDELELPTDGTPDAVAVVAMNGREQVVLVAPRSPWSPHRAAWARPVEGDEPWVGPFEIDSMSGLSQLARAGVLDGAVLLIGERRSEPRMWSLRLQAP